MNGRRDLSAIGRALGRWEGTASRRDFLKTSGLFVFGLSAIGAARAGFGAQPAEAGPYPDPDFLQLDSWLVVDEDGSATFYIGKTDGGQGTGTATRQMMCDELDLAFDRATVVMGRTDLTVDQGGSGGSDAIERDAMVGRRIAAEARRVLLEMASERFGVPVEELARERGRDLAGGRSLADRHLRRVDRRTALRRGADRRQHQPGRRGARASSRCRT